MSPKPKHCGRRSPNKSPEPLARSVPLSRFSSRVGGGSAFSMGNFLGESKTLENDQELREQAYQAGEEAVDDATGI